MDSAESIDEQVENNGREQQRQAAVSATRNGEGNGPGGGGGATVTTGNGSHMFVFTNEKAGMKGMKTGEKERANRIIYEMSKNSSYFRQAEQQDKKVDVKVTDMKDKLRALDEMRKTNLTRQADKVVAEFESQRELDNVCLVIDMDMFYAAVEIRDRPELADKPVAVGGSSMISTTNYHARKKGVRSAMPGFIGRKLCPDLVFVRPDFEKYTKVAERIRAIFREYDPRMRSYSLDEAYLNVTQALSRQLDEEDGLRPSTTMETPAEMARAQSPQASSNTDGSSMRQGCGPPSTHNARIRKHDDLPYSALPEECTYRRRRRRRRMENDHMVGDDERDSEEEDEDEEAMERGVGHSGRGHGGGVRGDATREERRARMFKAAEAMAEEIRRRIQETTELTASCGIGPNFMLAKIASDWNKPNGQWCIRGDRGEVLRFLHDLPVRKVGGVGKVMEKCLRAAMGVVTCGDLFRERAACMHLMTAHTARWLLKVSLGIGSADHDVATEQAEAAGAITRKQISKERTFCELHRPQDLLTKCREICTSLATEMATKKLEAKTIGLKIKTTKFNVRTQDHTGQAYVSTADELYATASTLLQREIRGATGASGGSDALRLRLMGIRASNFRGQAGIAPLPGQATLDVFFGNPSSSGGTEKTVANFPAEGTESRTPRDVDDATRAGIASEDTSVEGLENVASSRMEVEGFSGGVKRALVDARARDVCCDESTKEIKPMRDDGASRSSSTGGGAGVDADDDCWVLPEVEGRTPTAAAKALSLRSQNVTNGRAQHHRPRSPRTVWEPYPREQNGKQIAAVNVSPTPAVKCPICGQVLDVVSNAALNKHVDSCLGANSEPQVKDLRRGGLRAGGGTGRRMAWSRDETYGSQRPDGKRAKVSRPSGIERFLTPRERT